MNLFKRRNRTRKKWREKALLIDPHKSRLILVATESGKRLPHAPPWVYEKLKELTCNLDVQQNSDIAGINAVDFAFAARIRQEMGLEKRVLE